MSNKVIDINNVRDYDTFKKKYTCGVIFYSASWCEACSELLPLYERIANRYYKYVALGYVDIDKCRLDFNKVPVFVAFYKGEEVNSIEGADSDRLKEFIRSTIKLDEHNKELIKQDHESTRRNKSIREDINNIDRIFTIDRMRSMKLD